jgi:hypothetical protein
VKLTGNRLLARRLRQAVEVVVNDRRGLKWNQGLDAAVLRDLRKHVERVFVAVLAADPAAPFDALQLYLEDSKGSRRC